MAVNLLGPYNFHGFFGTPDFPETAIAGEIRPGVNGVTFTDIGTWGKPFTVDTIRGLADFQQAGIEWASYKVASDRDPLVMVIHGLIVPGGLFKVITVEQLFVGAVAHFHYAGDATIYRGLVRARWTLFPVALS